MKLATWKDGSRDGTLLVVNQEMTDAVKVPHIAGTMQSALDEWAVVVPQLQEIYQDLNKGNRSDAFAFDPTTMHSPLPRAYQWADGSAYVNHVELVRQARGAKMPESFWTDPLMYQGASDSFIGPCDPIEMPSTEWGIDFESEIAVIVDDTPMGVTAEDAVGHIQLIMLLNDVSLRSLIPSELAKGFGFFQSKPTTSFSPVAVTPDELSDAWVDAVVHLPLCTYLNGELFGKPNAGVDMTFNFGQLIAHAAKSRNLCAGTIVGSGTISNKDRSAGSSCLAERRMLEILEHGKPVTSFLDFGDEVKIEMLDRNGKSIFGAIDQKVVEYAGVSV